MRIYNDLPQHLEDGTANLDWLAVRAGLFTGSDFNQYMSLLKKNELSDTAESCLCEKVLESFGEQFDSTITPAMARGTELEPIARKEYIQQTFNDVQEVGFVDWERLRAGCSPDGVIYNETTVIDDMTIKKNDNGEPELVITEPKFITMRHKNDIKKIIEIKCPNIKNYLKMVSGNIPPLYKCQMQFNMLITGAKSCDFVVYHPDMQLFIKEIDADADFQADIVSVLEKLNSRYDEILEQIERYKK